MQKYVRRFLDDLPALQSNGVLDTPTAQRLRDYYQTGDTEVSKSWLLVAFGILGALLVGLGAILLIGHNWEQLTRPMRTGISFLPIGTMLAVVVYGLIKNQSSTAWRESVAMLWVLSIGASIALISQTYHIPGNFLNFLLAWIVLSVPVIYLLNGVAPAMACMLGITAWAVGSTWSWDSPLGFWLLAGAIAPYVVWGIAVAPNSLRSKLLQFGSAFALCFCLGFVMDKSMPGLWIITYSGFFACLYLYGRFCFDESASPFRGFGEIGGVIFALLLTMPWPWEAIGWRYYSQPSNHIWAFGLDLALAFMLVGAAVILLVTANRRKKNHTMLLGVLPIIAVIGYAVTAQTKLIFPSVILFSLYTFCMGIFQITRGFREINIRNVVMGFCIVAALIAIRFFDDDYGMIVRGLVFIALGIAFLVLNWIFAKRKKKVTA